MKLYGSLYSPFVRRIRLALASTPYEFIALNIFEGSDRDTLIRLNPTRKVPMLVDEEQVVFDSGVIARYLQEKLGWQKLSVSEENQLTLINAANDSLVELFLCKRSGFDIQEDRLFFNLQRERVTATLAVLEQQVTDGLFATWNYPAISLYCLVDWILFRELTDMTHYPMLCQFLTVHKQQLAVASTDPRVL